MLVNKVCLRWDDLEGVFIGDMIFSDDFIRIMIFLVFTKTDHSSEGQWCTIAVHHASEPWTAFTLLMEFISVVTLICKCTTLDMLEKMATSSDNRVQQLLLAQILLMCTVETEAHLPVLSKKVTYTKFD
eukprot:1917805-Rhodomonas_salina.2